MTDFFKIVKGCRKAKIIESLSQISSLFPEPENAEDALQQRLISKPYQKFTLAFGLEIKKKCPIIYVLIIRYKKGPAIRYKKGPSIRYIGSNLRDFFPKGSRYKVHWSSRNFSKRGPLNV